MHTIKNNWSVYRDPVARWEIDLTVCLDKPETLKDWLMNTIKAGSEQKVFTVKSAPLLLFKPNDERELADVLQEKWQTKRELDLFHFTDGGVLHTDGYRLSIETDLACYPNEKESEVITVENIGYLKADLNKMIGEPENGPKMWPLMLRGPLLCFDNLEESDWNGRRNSIRIIIELHTDIWFPYIRVYENASGEFIRQKNELSTFHTPRLNSFLSEVKRHTIAIGGTLKCDDEWSHPGYREYITDEGIRL